MFNKYVEILNVVLSQEIKQGIGELAWKCVKVGNNDTWSYRPHVYELIGHGYLKQSDNNIEITFKGLWKYHQSTNKLKLY